MILQASQTSVEKFVRRPLHMTVNSFTDDMSIKKDNSYSEINKKDPKRFVI